MHTLGPGCHMMDPFGLWWTVFNEIFSINFFLTQGVHDIYDQSTIYINIRKLSDFLTSLSVASNIKGTEESLGCGQKI